MPRIAPALVAVACSAACFSESNGNGDGGDAGTGSASNSGSSSGTAPTTVDPSTSNGSTASTDPTAETGSSGPDPDTTGGMPCDGPCPGEVGRVIELPLLVDVAALGTDALIVLGAFAGDLTFVGESLTNAAGSDMLIARMTTTGELVWLRQWSGDGPANPRGLSTAGGNRIAAACAYEAGMSIDGAMLPSPNDGERFVGVGVLDPDGNVLVSTALQGTTEHFGGIDIDTSARVLVSASFPGALTVPSLPPVTSAGGVDGALWEFQVGGASEYTARLGDVGRDTIVGVAYLGLGLGPARVVGEFSGTMATDAGVITSAGATDAYVAAADGNGGWSWARRIGGVGPDLARGVTVDAAGGVYVFGHFEDDLVPERGEGEVTPGVGVSDLVLTKYDVDGAFLWRRVWGGPGEEQARDVIVADGVVVAVGELRGQTIFDEVAITAPDGSTDALVIAVDAADGALRWVRGFGGSNDDRALSVAVTDEGVWVSMALYGEVDIDGTTVGSPATSGTALTLLGL